MPAVRSYSKKRPAYVHSADYFKAPDLHYDTMTDDEYESAGGSNRMRTEVEVQAIATEFGLNDVAALPALKVRLEQAAIYAASFAADDSEDAEDYICTFRFGAGKVTAPLVQCIDILRVMLDPPEKDMPLICPTCGRS